jgi:hypothetical protein
MTKAKTQIQIQAQQIQNTTPTQQIQAQNTTPTQNATPTRRVITISPSREGVRGRPTASKPSRDYIIAKLGELLVSSDIDLGDYVTVKHLQVYVTSYTSNYVQGLLLSIAKHKEQEDIGIMVNLAFRININSGDLKVSVKNAIRLYNPLLLNLTNLVKDLDVTYVFK